MDAPLRRLRQHTVDALARVDGRGRLTRQDAHGLRPLARAVREAGPRPSGPEALFGLWVDLPVPVQRHLRRAVERAHRWARRAELDYAPVQVILRGLLTLQSLARRRGLVRAASLCERAYQILARRPRRWRYAVSSAWAALRWRCSPRPPVSALIGYLGESPLWLAGGFVRGVRIPPGNRTYVHDGDRNVIAGYLIGLDLVPGIDGVWLVESNLSAGLPPGILSIAEDLALASARSVAAQGATHLFWIHGSRARINDELRAALHAQATAQAFDLRLLEDPCLPRLASADDRPPRPSRGLHVPRPVPADTLVIRVHGDGSGMGAVVAGKNRFLTTLASGLSMTGSSDVRVPLMSADAPEPPPVPAGFPNLVYKYPDEHRGQGVFFLRARDRDHALQLAADVDERTGWKGGLFQPYVVPQLCSGRRVQHVRAMLLLTPRESTLATCVRLTSSRPVPEALDWGVVTDGGLFASNLALGATRSLPEGDDRARIERATVAVGEALQAVLAEAFVIDGS